MKNSFLLILILISLEISAQTTDSTVNFSGTVGITNNGFSIIPTFSLNSPAVIMNFYVRKKRFSFDPDIRLVPDASKGGFIFWLRYYAVQKKKFSLRLGVHPAFTFVRRTIVDNGVSIDITESMRFGAFEVVPAYQITPNWSVGAVFLHGSAFQKHGPQNTNVLFLNTAISNITLGNNFKFQFVPMVYFLNTDGYKGNYLAATGILSNSKSPFSFSGSINQTFNSNIPDNQNFMWNVMLAYSFGGNYRKVH